MPDDAMERVSLHTKSPVDGSSPFSHQPFPQRSKSHLKVSCLWS